MRILIFVLFFAGVTPKVLLAGDPKYPVYLIPDSLKKDANAVVRQDEMVFEIISQNQARLTAHYVVTILNEKGKDFSEIHLDYDKLTKITELKASVYDALGTLIKKVKPSDIYDHSLWDGVSLYSDNRLKSIDLSQGHYPYTIEIEYVKEYKFLYFIDGSYIIPDENVSVQHTSYKLIYPTSIAPRFKAYNISITPVKEIYSDGRESLSWSFKDLPAMKDEPLSPSRSLFPQLSAAPGNFEFDSYSGNMSTWDEFGKWICKLNKGRNVLPASTVEKLISLTASLETTEQKVKAVYEYLQGRTRYVGIQLGIGGFQPFEASVVDNTGYGDCKALSNYTVSMLESIGVKAHYVLINAGRNARQIDTSFPSSQFNHAIVAVPNGRDTLWLECTSQTIPFGYQGTFTGDRKALLITDNGGVIVNTTQYPAEKNLQNRFAQVDLEMNGNARAEVRTLYTGLQYENDYLDAILGNQYDEQKKWIQNTTKIPTFNVNNFSFTDKKDRIPSAIVTIDLSLPRLLSVSGKRLFLTPNLMTKQTYIPEKSEGRKTDVILKRAFIQNDTIVYKYSDSIYPEYLPQPIKLKTRFGEYESTFNVDAGSLVYTRRLRMEKGSFPKESYNELVDFLKSVNKADNTKVVFLNKT